MSALQACCALVWCHCLAANIACTFSCMHMHPMQRLGDDEKRCRSVSVTNHTIISLQSFLMPIPSMTHVCSIDCTLIWASTCMLVLHKVRGRYLGNPLDACLSCPEVQTPYCLQCLVPLYQLLSCCLPPPRCHWRAHYQQRLESSPRYGDLAINVSHTCLKGLHVHHHLSVNKEWG